MMGFQLKPEGNEKMKKVIFARGKIDLNADGKRGGRGWRCMWCSERDRVLLVVGNLETKNRRGVGRW